jgi:hypothetical protein
MNNDCTHLRPHLTEHLLLGTPLPRDLTRHLNQCPDCTREATELHDVIHTLRRGDPLAELTGPHELAAGPRHVPAQIGHGDILDLPAQSVTRIERLRDVISTRTEDSAAVLRSWIESPESRKEPAGS